MSEAIDLLTDALAVYRATRLVTADDLTAGIRDRIVEAAYVGAGKHGKGVSQLKDQHEGKWGRMAEMDPDAPKLATLVTCRWCAGMWLSAGALTLRFLLPRAWRTLSRLGALSATAALVAGLEKD